MKERLTIVKVGGKIIENDASLSLFIEAFTQLKGKKLLVHGGGNIATKLASDLGIQTHMIDGRRVTNDRMIEVVIMSYGGLINKKLVALLNAGRVNSIGLTGADGNCILSCKRPIKNGVDYGWVGDIESVDANFLGQLIVDDITPVLAPLTYDRQGHLLNTNADTISSEVAIALSAKYEVTLNYVFDQKGVMKDISNPDSLIRSIDLATYDSLKKEHVITDGMIPKLDNAFYTIEKGVTEVKLLNVDALSNLQNSEFDEYTSIR